MFIYLIYYSLYFYFFLVCFCPDQVSSNNTVRSNIAQAVQLSYPSISVNTNQKINWRIKPLNFLSQSDSLQNSIKTEEHQYQSDHQKNKLRTNFLPQAKIKQATVHQTNPWQNHFSQLSHNHKTHKNPNPKKQIQTHKSEAKKRHNQKEILSNNFFPSNRNQTHNFFSKPKSNPEIIRIRNQNQRKGRNFVSFFSKFKV
jgi:hypothetical protein